MHLLDPLRVRDYHSTVSETADTRIGVRKCTRRATAERRYFFACTSCAAYGRALTGEPSGSPVPCAPVRQPCLVPGHPIWRWGAGLPYPHKEPATCKKLSLVLSFRNPLLRLSARRYVPPQLRHRIEQPSMRAATRCAFWQPLPQGAGGLMHKSFSSPLDAAMINVERLSALAGLLAIEDVVSAFANLSPLAQVALFGTFESGLVEVRTALLQMAKNGDGRSISAPF
ncbi:hypothetical protein NCF_03147 [Burkholderia pseudomallei]